VRRCATGLITRAERSVVACEREADAMSCSRRRGGPLRRTQIAEPVVRANPPERPAGSAAMAHPRPLAGLPAADPRRVARAWLVRRIAAAPLEAAAGLADAAFVERAPGLCGSLVAALIDDAALAALRGEAEALGALAALPGEAEALGALAALPGEAEALGALAALPGEAEALRVLVDAASSPAPAPFAPAALVTATEHLRGAVVDVVVAGTDPELHAALHDRLAHACAQLLEGALAAPGAITVHDARAPGDPRGRLTAEAERLVVARVRFALLAVEVEDAAVLPAGILAAAEVALNAALPPSALHAPDGPGSMLVLAREADGGELARALTQAVATAASHRGAPLRAAAGIAEHPRDGDTPEGLLAHADGQLFAARAEGLPLA